MSLIFGTLSIVVIPFTKSAAGIKAKAEFLAPLIVTSPIKVLLPSIINFSMILPSLYSIKAINKLP